MGTQFLKTLRIALETAIIYTLKRCCDECDIADSNEDKCGVVKMYGKAPYKEIVDNSPTWCGTFDFPLFIPEPIINRKK